MRRKNKVLVILGVVLLVVAVLAVIFVPRLIDLWNTPLGPSHLSKFPPRPLRRFAEARRKWW